MGSGDRGVGGREDRGREGAGGGSGKERKVQNCKRREVGRKCATMLNISQSKRAKGGKPRKKRLEVRKQGTGCTTLRRADLLEANISASKISLPQKRPELH